ncbi:hypothetical protein EDD11_005274 [Mortierella claussenii]|nr:hypothetical protein EDD11_005274 [Mortierella claussenii]
MDSYDNNNNNNSSSNMSMNDTIDVLKPTDTDAMDDAFPHEDPHYRRYEDDENRHRSRDSEIRRDDRGSSRSPDRARDYHSSASSRSHHDRDNKYESNERRPSQHDQGRARSRSRSPGRNTAGSSSRDRRVYVGNLSYDVKWTNLKDFMREVGPVAHADVLLNHDGRSKGCGVVEFQNAEDAKEAIRRLNDVVLMGRPVFVREDRESESRIGFSGGRGAGTQQVTRNHDSSNTRQVYVGNLPYSVDWKDLKDLFRRAGPVERADVFLNGEGRSKGSGTVSFERFGDVGRAISMFHGYDWHGRRIEVREDKYGPPSGAASRGSASRSEPSRGGGYNGSYGHGSSGHGGRGGYGDYRHESSGRQSDFYDGNSRSSHHNGGYNDISMEAIPSGPAAGSGDQIYIRNLPFTTTEQDLRDLFRTCGPIRMTEILMSAGRPKGSGVVRFEMFESADKAVAKFNGYIYGGRPLEIVYDRA